MLGRVKEYTDPLPKNQNWIESLSQTRKQSLISRSPLHLEFHVKVMSDWILNKTEKSNSLSSQNQNLFGKNNVFRLPFSQILKNAWESFSSPNIN